MANKSPIGIATSNEIKAEFARELAALTVFSEEELKAIFPKQEDAEALKKLIDSVNSATDENDKRTKLIGNIESVAHIVTKLATKVVAP